MTETQDIPRRSIALPGETIGLLQKMAEADERSMTRQIIYLVKVEAEKRGLTIDGHTPEQAAAHRQQAS